MGAEVVDTGDFDALARFAAAAAALEDVVTATLDEPSTEDSSVDPVAAGSVSVVCTAATAAPGSGAAGCAPAEKVR